MGGVGWDRMFKSENVLGKDSRNFNSLNKLGLNLILTNMAENSFSFFPHDHPNIHF